MFKLDNGKLKKEIHIFDIDGCIFPSVNNQGVRIMPDINVSIENDMSIETVKENMKDVKLFSEFVDYYNYLYEKCIDFVFYFVTGRKKKYFWNETVEQLSFINTSKERTVIKCIPDYINVTKKTYYNFKIYTINNIVMNDKKKSNIHIYDDVYGYYNVLEKWFNDGHLKNIIFHKVIKPVVFWESMLFNYQNLLQILQENMK